MKQKLKRDSNIHNINKNKWINEHCKNCGIYQQHNTSWNFKICYLLCLDRSFTP